jgi:hypothetical protein
VRQRVIEGVAAAKPPASNSGTARLTDYARATTTITQASRIATIVSALLEISRSNMAAVLSLG